MTGYKIYKPISFNFKNNNYMKENISTKILGENKIRKNLQS